MMNNFTNILCDTSPLMVPQDFKGALPHGKISHHNMSSKLGPMLLDSVSQISSMNTPLSSVSHSSPSNINLFNSSDQIHIPPKMNPAFDDGSSVSVFSDSFPEIVPSWLAHDFMKVSDNLASPGILSNVSDIYSANQETEHLEMLDLGFTPELTSQDVADNLNRSCLNDSQKILDSLPVQRFSSSEALMIPSFNDLNSTHLHISMNKNNMQYQKFKQNGPDVNSTQSLMKAVLPCENELLHLPLPSSLTEQCLNSTSSPSMISSSQSQSHPVDVVCDKLPQINLNHLDSLLGHETSLSEIQLLRHDFPHVRLSEDGCHSHSNHACLESYNHNDVIISCDTTNILGTAVSSLPQSQDVSVQVSANVLVEQNTSSNLNCLNCKETPLELPIEVIQCFKCKFCDYVNVHKCAVASHINISHSKSPDSGSDYKNALSNVRSDNLNSLPVGGHSETHFNGSNNLIGSNDLSLLNVNRKNSDLISVKDNKGNLSINCISNMSQNNIGKISKLRKILAKKTDETQKNNPKKVVNEPAVINNNKNVSSFKKAWQKKITRELGSFICEFKGCNVRFRALDNLEYHKKCHSMNGKAFKCPECSTDFDNWAAIAGHLWRIHSNDMELHACDQCPFRTYSLSRLENLHKRIHKDECLFLCDTCGKSFKNGKQLRNHRVIHQNSKKSRQAGNYICDICSKSFTTNHLLRHHQRTVHYKIKPYLCDYCEYTASKKSTMNLHIRLHTGEKPFKCDTCDFRTSDHNTLRRHKITHSGEKPYKCPYCSYSCISAYYYKTHLNRKHPGEYEGLIFSCNICPFKSIKQELYKTHMFEHEHGNMSTGENSMTGMQSTDEMFPFAAAMGKSLSESDNLFSGININKNMQSFSNGLNYNMVSGLGQLSTN